MKNDFIVLADNLEDILKMAVQIQKQSVLPNFIVFGLLEELTITASIDLQLVLGQLSYVFDDKVKFVVTRILNKESNFTVVDICVRKCKGSYYSILLANEELPDYFNSKVQKVVNEHMKNDNQTIYMIRPKEGIHGLVIHRGLHKHLGGSVSFDENAKPYTEKITDKILGYAKKEAIYEWQI